MHVHPLKLAAFVLLASFGAPSLAADTSPLAATALDGARFDLAGERGQVVVVNFWATWCAPCRAEMPALDEYYRAHRGEGLVMLAISLDAGASRKKLLGATAAFRFPIARIADTRMARSAIPTGLPATRIYGRDGTLRYDSAARHDPPLDPATIARIVAPLLAEPAPTTR